MPDSDKTLADGRYQLLEAIGSGGMATVYRAMDGRLQVTRAVKILSEDFIGKPKIRARFEAEARTMAILDHPNIVRVYDVGSEGEMVYIVMELVEGKTLLDRIEQSGPLAPVEALDITRSVLDGLRAAHNQGIVHRDIKPHNILISHEGRVRLTDFGIAQSSHLTEESFTKTGAVMGTWAFMAPEQRVNSKGVDLRADIYGVGATLFAMVTQRTPMDLFASDLDPIMLRGVPETVLPIIRNATRYQPDERYASASIMLLAVEEGLSGSSTQAVPLRSAAATTTPLPPPGQARPLVSAEATFLPEAGMGLAVPDVGVPTATLPPPLPSPAPAESTRALSEGLDSGTLLPENEVEPEPVEPERTHRARMVMGLIAILVMLAIGSVGRWMSQESTAPLGPEPQVQAAVQRLPVPAPRAVPQAQERAEEATEAVAEVEPPPEEDEEEEEETPVEAPEETPVPPEPPAVEGPPGVSPGLSLVASGPGSAMRGERVSFSARIPAASVQEHKDYMVRLSFRPTGGSFQRPRTMRREGKTWRASILVTEQMSSGIEWCMFAKPDPVALPKHPKLTAVSCQSPRRVKIRKR